MSFKAGLIGYGSGGRIFHAPLLEKAGITLAAIASSKVDAIASDFPHAAAYKDPEALVADQSLDLVIVSTPSHTHADVAIMALKAGHHVVVDKPFAPSAADADRIISEAKAAGRHVTCFQNRRWDSDFLTIRDLLAQGVLGDIHDYRAHFEFFKPDAGDTWKNEALPGVGVHYDLGTHMLDQAIALFGMPQWVEADLRTLRSNGRAPDHMFARLGYPDKRATLIASMFSAYTDERYVIHGSSGSFHKRFMDCQEEQLKAGITPSDPDYGVEDPSTFGELILLDGDQTTRKIHQSHNGQHWKFYELMRLAIQEGGAVPVAPEGPRDALLVIEALMRASDVGQRIEL
ncbi:MAG: Gfo/Idh/MocA family oxidoreductase [Pseudomonadota bacterium]